ncbi:protein of unknown function [Roseivivax lentus]|uniref:DUF4167 domain-containing protein n=2 Tax=Roseivivax lentus TaxID=633194 RepID=A0A1N7N0P0_9RHOB|nr:protein of unknown function [Roseivivax lentus]
MGNVVNRVFDSSGPDGKVRGTPQQIIDKYNQLARDAQLGNDRVATENFQQHAEHYQRMLSEAQREQDQKREQQERENRERQAQRDRERNDRDGDDKSQHGGHDSGDDQRGHDGNDPGRAPQPETAGNGDGGNGNDGGQSNNGGNGGGNGNQGGSNRRRRGKSAGGEGGSQDADVVDLNADDDESHLVETPENAEKPKPKRKPRRKPAEAQESGQTPAPAEDAANEG